MKFWFAIAGFILATFGQANLRFDVRLQWTGPERPPYLTPDHKPTAKPPDARLA